MGNEHVDPLEEDDGVTAIATVRAGRKKVNKARVISATKEMIGE
jgi:hypothetical protein